MEAGKAAGQSLRWRSEPGCGPGAAQGCEPGQSVRLRPWAPDPALLSSPEAENSGEALLAGDTPFHFLTRQHLLGPRPLPVTVQRDP